MQSTSAPIREPRLVQHVETSPSIFPFGTRDISSLKEVLKDRYTPDIEAAFPDISPPYRPHGYLVLLQLRMPRKKIGSIHVPDDSADMERHRTQAALVRAIGPTCFCNRETGEPWREGAWFAPGDFVRGPMFGGDRFFVDIKPLDGPVDKVTFAFVRDSDVTAAVVADPLTLQTS